MDNGYMNDNDDDDSHLTGNDSSDNERMSLLLSDEIINLRQSNGELNDHNQTKSWKFYLKRIVINNLWLY